MDTCNLNAKRFHIAAITAALCLVCISAQSARADGADSVTISLSSISGTPGSTVDVDGTITNSGPDTLNIDGDNISVSGPLADDSDQCSRVLACLFQPEPNCLDGIWEINGISAYHGYDSHVQARPSSPVGASGGQIAALLDHNRPFLPNFQFVPDRPASGNFLSILY